MKTRFIKLFIIFFLSSSCSENLLSGSSDVDPDDDYYSKAMDSLNQQDYDSAIAIITTKVSANGQTTVRSRDLLSSAYAGKCGLNFLDYTDKLSQLSTGSAFSMMMSPFVQAAIADPTYCRQALATLELIGPTESRTANQNVFASITGMVLIGTALRTSADLSPALGDGTTDVNLCTGLTDAQVDDIIIGFGYFNKNFSAVGDGVIGSGSSASFGQISAACTAVPGAVCNIISQSDITPALRDFYRDVINTQDYGLGNFSTGGDPMQIPNSCP